MCLGVLHWPGRAQVMRCLFLGFVIVVLAATFSPAPVFAQSVDTDAAYAECLSWAHSRGQSDCAYVEAPSQCSATYGAWYALYGDGSKNCYLFFGNNCHAGAIVPSGTPYLFSSTTGEACRASDMCQLSFQVGGSNSGGYSLTGATCSAHGADFTGGDTPDPSVPPPPGTPPPETSNPDGSTTFCDQISGTCVTAAPGAGAPPPSTGDGGDHADNGSTDSSSTTTNGATSSTTTTNTSSTTTSTTNTTTTGGGTSGGSGDSTSVGTTTGTTTGTQTSTTDTPASSSSTSSKCTTGVCDVGQADGIMGGMYEPSGETPASVYANFRTSVSSSALGTAVTGFFNTAGINGSCPTWHIPGNIYWGADGFSFDFFCSSGMLALLALAGLLVLAVGAFSAFRIAIY